MHEIEIRLGDVAHAELDVTADDHLQLRLDIDDDEGYSAGTVLLTFTDASDGAGKLADAISRFVAAHDPQRAYLVVELDRP
jgi:hypothetical protein